MVRKKIAMAVLAFSAMQAGMVNALGLGNVAVKSQLNQPLAAEIRLLETADLDEAQVRVQLAGLDDFERAGVERDHFLNNLKFSVELDQRGNGVIRVSTREPVVEPYLNFIIEARWPSGRLLREYAVLLDPPTFSADATPATRTDTGLNTVQQQSRAVPAPTYRAPAAPDAARTVPAASRAFPAAAGETEYRVQNSDTLLQIAARARPASDISVQQTMLAIQQANPDAFIRNNINLIKAGSVLRLPDADAVRRISAATATQEVAAQNQAWRGGDMADDLTAPQLDGRASDESSGGAERVAERLSIASAGDSERTSAGDGAGSPDDAGVAALKSELLTTQETLDSARRENGELASRLDDMERQIATLQRLLALKDDQLAALQSGSADASATASTDADTDTLAAAEQDATAVDETASAEPDYASPESLLGGRATDGDADPLAGDDLAEDGAEEASADENSDDLIAAVPPPTAEKPTPKPAKPARPAEPDGLQALLANPWLPGGAAALIALLAAGIFFARRRRNEAEEAAEAEALAALAAEREAPEPVTVAETSPIVAAPLVAAPGAATVVAGAIGDEVTEEPAAAIAPVPVRQETGDVIAEADIYIAYGRYQQAANLLRSAIEREPARSDLRIKLLEVHLETRDREAFRHEFVELQALGDEQATAHVKEMLSSIDGVADWLNGLPGGGSAFAALVGGAVVAASTAAADTDAVDENEDELFGLDVDEESDAVGDFQLDLDSDVGAATEDDELELDWLNDTTEAANADEGFALDLDDADEQPAPVPADAAPLATDELQLVGTEEPRPVSGPDETDGDFGDLLEISDLSLEDEEPLPLTVEEPAHVGDTAPADVLGELDLDLDDDAFSLEDDDLDRALTELGGDSTDALNDEFGALGGEEIALGEFGGGPAVMPVDVAAQATETGGAEEASVEEGLLEEAPADEPFGLDDFPTPADGAADTVAETGSRLVVEPDPVAAELTVEGLGDLDPATLDEGFDFDDLGQLDGTAADTPVAPTDAIDEAFADFEALSAELDAAAAEMSETGVEPLDDTREPAFEVDLDAIQPYTSETAAAEEADEFDFLADADEVATKLDLARAYIDMGDTDGARDILGEVVQEGTNPQREEAQSLLDRID